jgi:hypothetical protein
VIDQGSGVKSTITSGITPPAVLAPQTARINNKSRRPRVAAGFKYPTFVHTRRRETQNQQRRKSTRFHDIVETPDNAVAAQRSRWAGTAPSGETR